MTRSRVLVPIDYSDSARAALEAAASIAERLGADIVVLHAWECPPFAAGVRVVPPVPGAAHRPLDELIVESAERELSQFVASFALPEAVSIEQKLVANAPARAILDEIAAGDYELVVMGTHGRGRVEAMLLGSVAERVLRLSTIPVLVVPPRGGHGARR